MGSPKRPRVYRDDRGWWASLPHDGWDDATAFDTWAEAIYHAEYLHNRQRDRWRCEAACPPGHPHVPCVRPFRHPGRHSATPMWADLFGIDPDYTGGMPVDRFLEESRGEA